MSSVSGPFHAPAVVQDALDLDDLTGQPALPATSDEVLQHGSFGGAGTGKGVDERQGALALVEVAVDLLAVHRLVAGDVEQVVVDLERRAEQKTEGVEPVEVLHIRVGDDRADAHRVD